VDRYVEIKALPGRIAFTDASGAKQVPHDQYIRVERTDYIDRLIKTHGDVEVKPNTQATAQSPKKAA
jgi:hypothetical protein